MPIIQAEALERSIGEVLEAAGCPPGPAAIVAESLVLSNLKGTDSHGLIRLAQYVGEIESGRTVPGRKPSVTERDGLIHVDGGWGFGPVGAPAGRPTRSRARPRRRSLARDAVAGQPRRTARGDCRASRRGELRRDRLLQWRPGGRAGRRLRRPWAALRHESTRVCNPEPARTADRRRLLHGGDRRGPRASREAEWSASSRRLDRRRGRDTH